MGIEFQDLTKWEKRLLIYVRSKMPKEYRKLLRQSGNLLRKNVRRATAKKEGELRKSYRVKVMPKDSSVLVYTNKFYAKMVEEGHPIVKYSRRGRNYPGMEFRKRFKNIKPGKMIIGLVPGKFYFRKGFEQTERELPDLLKKFLRDMGKEMGLDVTG